MATTAAPSGSRAGRPVPAPAPLVLRKSKTRGLGLRNITNTNLADRGRAVASAKKAKKQRRSQVAQQVPRQAPADGVVSKALQFPDTEMGGNTAAAPVAGIVPDCYVDHDDDLDSDEDMGAAVAPVTEAVAPPGASATGNADLDMGDKTGLVPHSEPIQPSPFHPSWPASVSQGWGSVASDAEDMAAELERLRAENEELREIVERHAPKHVQISSEVYSVHHNKVTPIRLDRSLSVHTAAVLQKSVRPQPSELVKNMVMLFSHRQGFEQYVKKRAFASDLIQLARMAAKTMAKEERLLDLASPVYIFGDIHGNLKDLHFFSDNLWKFGVHLTAGRFLFLGDYVDRGQQSLEVVAYLFSLKLSAPHKFFLLRGNHELRKVNGWEDWYKSGSFLWQCKDRFGDDIGAKVWEEVNRAFDCMPLAALVDSSIFCCHGGIPRPLPGMTHSPPQAASAKRTPLRPASSSRRRSSVGSAPGDGVMRLEATTRRLSLGSDGLGSPDEPRRTSLLDTPRPGKPSRRHHDRRLDAIRAVPCPIRLDAVHEETLTHAATVGAALADAPPTDYPIHVHQDAASIRLGDRHGNPRRRDRAAAAAAAAAMTPGSRAMWAESELTPELVQRVALDMLWADPAADEAEADLAADGFGPGLRGGDTVQYGQTAIEEFLDGNGLQLIVRAHQAISTGIGICKHARVFTVFSTSKDHGCGASATCGCLLVEDGRVLPIMRAPTRPSRRRTTSSSASAGAAVAAGAGAGPHTHQHGHRSAAGGANPTAAMPEHGPQPKATEAEKARLLRHSSHHTQHKHHHHHHHQRAPDAQHTRAHAHVQPPGLPRPHKSRHAHAAPSSSQRQPSSRRLSRSGTIGFRAAAGSTHMR